MKLNVLHGLILCTCIVCAVAQAPAPAPSHNRDEKVEHVSFVTEDGALIYADLYGKGNGSGVVLVMAVDLLRRVGSPRRNA